jgi:hypothetical protein
MAIKLLKTPKLIAVWPHLHAPDTKFNVDGIYGTKGSLKGELGAQMAAQWDAAIAASVAEAKADAKNKGKKIKQADAPYSFNEETEEYTFNFKLNAKGKRKDGTVFTQAPALYDARGGKIPAGVRIGGGSTIVVAYELSPFYTALVGAGITARLKAVQVLNLVQFGGTASSFGFDTDEDGFDASGMEAEAPRSSEEGATEVEREAPSAGEDAPQSGADF